MKKIVLIIPLLIGFTSFGQEMKLDQIDGIVKSIESDSTLTLKEYDWKILSGITTGSEGIRKTWVKKKRLHKIIEEIEYLDYITKTAIYLENGVPIKIVEKEENYKNTADGFDYSKPIEVFSTVIYVFDWENDESKIIRNGMRVHTEGSCSNFDYETLLENTITE